MKAMKFPEAGKAEIVDVPVPALREGEVLVRVRSAGVCHSDVASFLGKHDVRRPPVITGHELAGEIVEVGRGVAGRRVGERVAVEPHVGCGHCVYCRQGHYHECPQKRFTGVGDWIGAFAEYTVATEAMCHPIPDRMGYDEGAMLEPLCVGLHAARRAELKLGERVAILGVGTIGMMTLLCVRCCGPGWMGISDPSKVKRETALRLGADLAVDPAQADPVQEIVRATDDLGADVVFVAVALDPVLQQALLACRRMGRLVVIASFFTGGALAARQLQVRERLAIGTSMYTADDYRLAIRLWERGHFPELSSLVAERITLEQAPAAVAALAYGKQPDAIKVIIRFDS